MFNIYLEFADRQFWDTVIFIVFGVGVAAAAFRLYQDFSRPLPSDERSNSVADDTQPRPPQ